VYYLRISDNAGDGLGQLSLIGNALYPALKVSLNGYALYPALSASPLDFGSQAVDASGAVRNLTLTNSGTAPLTIGNIAVTGANAGDFVLSSTDNCLATPIAPVGSCTVGVGFKPTTAGLRSATLSITDNAADSPQNLVLSGNGLYPTASFSPSSLDFGDQRVATTSAAQNLNLTNTGVVPLTVTGATLGGLNPADFSVTSVCSPGLVGPNTKCAISVSFNPTSPGHRSAILSILSNAADSPQSVTLTGNGLPLPTATPTIPVTRCPAHPSRPPLTVGIAPDSAGQTQSLPLSAGTSSLSATGGGTLPLTIRTSAKARVIVTLEAVTTHVTVTGTGADRKRTAHRVVLYQLVQQGVSDGHGRLSPVLKIAYQPNVPQQATLSVTVQTPCGSITQRTRVTILPLTIHLLSTHVGGGGILRISLHTGVRGLVTLTLQVATTRTVTTGSGRHVTRTVVRYKSQVRGIADQHGQFTKGIRINYKPVRPERLVVVATVHMAQGIATGRASATIVPLHQH
jgi:hypothetical protein